MAGSLHLFKITRRLSPENVKLKRNIPQDIIELDWKEVNATLNGNKINLPTSVTISLKINSKLDALSKEKPSFFILC